MTAFMALSSCRCESSSGSFDDKCSTVPCWPPTFGVFNQASRAGGRAPPVPSARGGLTFAQGPHARCKKIY